MTEAPRVLDVTVPCDSEAIAEAVVKALEVETRSAPPRTRVTITRVGSNLQLHVESDDTRGLRAGAHSFLRIADAAIAVARTALPPR